ncbi:MAG TPA: amylosucrase [Nocardioidaceae bacterium]|nr:amylosucrase [Nocardioidaceae bacterium]
MTERIEKEAVARLGLLEGAAFAARLEQVGHDLRRALTGVYGEEVDVEALVLDALEAAAARPEALAVLDRRREVDPSWFLSEQMIGYVCYADRFAGTLEGVADHLHYLEQLGVSYLHLMPLLEPREGENDGGYAVADYDAVDPRVGTMADLEALAAAAHDRGIALCIDLVLNHTAREHAWARAAVAGDPTYRRFYRFFPDRTQPDAYERTLPEVFPDMAPGSFTFVPETGEWVWTTFHEFQWDLDWSNPDVFRAMLGVILRLANRGVDVVRLDAVPFLWKRLGTDCQNQPETHLLLQALKALTRLARPGLVLKAEAIVGPDQLVPYLGAHDEYVPECDLAYDNQLMVMLWSTLATRDARLAVQALGRRRPPPTQAGWVTYVRCHDDIGWAVSDTDAWALGLNPAAHRRFLADFYSGIHPGSFARGLEFQRNEATGDIRTSGSCASLAGLERALEAGDEGAVEAALRRIETLYSVAFSFGGIPLVYMGDEIAQRNDEAWAATPAHADDNRWVHRPPMDWAAAERRTRAGSVEQRAFAALRSLGEVRRKTRAFRSDGATSVFDTGNTHVLGYVRSHPRATSVLALANFSDHEQSVPVAALGSHGFSSPFHLHSTQGRVVARDGRIHLPAWGFLWVTSNT